MSQKRDGAGRFARSAVRPPSPEIQRALAFTPTVEKAEQARANGLHGVYRRHLDRAAEILDAEGERGHDPYLVEAVEAWRRVRARDFVARGEREAARLTLITYSGGGDAVGKSADLLLADFRRR